MSIPDTKPSRAVRCSVCGHSTLVHGMPPPPPRPDHRRDRTLIAMFATFGFVLGMGMAPNWWLVAAGAMAGATFGSLVAVGAEKAEAEKWRQEYGGR